MCFAADDGWTVSEGRAPSEWGFALDSSGLQAFTPLQPTILAYIHSLSMPIASCLPSPSQQVPASLLQQVPHGKFNADA